LAASVISISSVVSVESVGSSFSQVILIGSISVEVSVAPEVGATVVVLPIGVLELDTHSSSEADLSESPPHPPAIVSPSSELSLVHVVAPPKIPLTARKSVRTLPSHRLALRYTSHHLDHFTFRSSSSHSSSNNSSSGHSCSGHSLFGHTPPDTTDTDSSTPQRFVHPPLVWAPQCSEAYLRWRFRDFISPEDSVKEDIDLDVLEDTEDDATTIDVAVDRDVEDGIDAGIGMEVDVRIDVEYEVEDEVESSDRGTMKVGVDMDVGIDIPNGMLMPDSVENLEQVEDGLQEIYDHVIEIPLQRIENIEITQRQLEACQLIASEE
nr:hypothetical protein [Tanacetum cinerariifolium]GFA74906.1 hypothetical protein [Tanacetum cinerariifolium]